MGGSENTPGDKDHAANPFLKHSEWIPRHFGLPLPACSISQPQTHVLICHSKRKSGILTTFKISSKEDSDHAINQRAT